MSLLRSVIALGWLSTSLAAASEPVQKDGPADALPAGAVARLGTTRFSHASPVVGVRFAHGGRSIVTFSLEAGSRVSVTEWDAVTGKEHHHADLPDPFQVAIPHIHWIIAPDGRTVAHQGRLREVRTGLERQLATGTFSPDGQTMAAVEVQGPRGWGVGIWQVSDGTKVQTLRASPDGEGGWRQARFLLFSANGKVLIGRDGARIVAGWDLSTGGELPRLTMDASEQAGGIPVLSPDGQVIAQHMSVEDRPNVIRLWQARTGKPIRDLISQRRLDTGSLLFSPDGRTLATWDGRDKSTLHLWDAGSGKELPVPEISERDLTELVFAPDGRTLALGLGNTAIGLYDIATGKLLRRLSQYQSHLGDWCNECSWFRGQLGPSIAFSPDGTVIASAGSDNRLRRWRVSSGEELWPAGEHHRASISALAWAPDGKTLATASGDGTFRLWDSASGRSRLRLGQSDRNDTSDPGRLAFAPDGKLLATAVGGDSTVQLWDPATGKVVRQIEAEDRVTSLAFTADGKIVTAGTVAGQARSWETASGQSLREFSGPLFPIDRTHKDENEPQPLTVAVSRNGRVLAGLTGIRSELSVQLWELPTGKLRRQWRTPDDFSDRDRVGAVAFSPDGRFLAWNSGPTVRLWDALAGKELRRFSGLARVNDFAFAPSGKWLAAAHANGSISIWEMDTATMHGTLTGHRGPAEAVAFSPDGARLASAGADTTALIWDVARILDGSPRRPFSAKDLARLWDRLASEEGEQAGAAMAELLVAPEQFVLLVRERVRPAAPVDAVRIGRLLADLESEEFKVREQAAAELEKLGETAELQLEERLTKQPTLEVRRRVERLLERVRNMVPTAAQARELRAVEMLGQIATPDAGNLLRELAAGAPQARLTQEARTALKGLGERASK